MNLTILIDALAFGWFCVGPCWISSIILRTRWRPKDRTSKQLGHVLVSLTVVTALCFFLSLLHALDRPSVCVSLAILVLITKMTSSDSRRLEVAEISLDPCDEPSHWRVSHDWPASLFVVVGFLALLTSLRIPPSEKDTLSYHLPIILEWITSGSIWTVAYPGGENLVVWSFTPYYPGNAELPCFWTMLALQGDDFANTVPLVFTLLTALALRGIFERLEVGVALARLACWTWIFLPYSWDWLFDTGWIEPVWIFYLLTSVYFLLDASNGEATSRHSAILAGLAVGLLGGSKSSAPAFIFGMVLILAPYIDRVRVIAIGSGLAVLAGPWYVRNWLVAGSPVFPVKLSILGWSPFQGYWEGGPTTLLSTGLEPRLYETFLSVSIDALGPVWLICFMGALASLWLAARRICVLQELPARPALAMIGLAFFASCLYLITPLTKFWIQFTFRHALPAVVFWLAVAVILADRNPQYRRPVASLLTLSIAFGFLRAVPGHIPHRDLCLLFLVGAFFSIIPWSFVRRWGACVAVLACFALPIPVRLSRLKTRLPIYVSAYRVGQLANTVSWLEENGGASTVAWAGFSNPYYFAGQSLERKLVYVNVNSCPQCRFHDYKDGNYRKNPDFVSWCDNLKAAGVSFLVTGYYDMNDFPIEDAWARSHSDLFELVASDPKTRLYRLLEPIAPALRGMGGLTLGGRYLVRPSLKDRKAKQEARRNRGQL